MLKCTKKTAPSEENTVKIDRNRKENETELPKSKYRDQIFRNRGFDDVISDLLFRFKSDSDQLERAWRTGLLLIRIAMVIV